MAEEDQSAANPASVPPRLRAAAWQRDPPRRGAGVGKTHLAIALAHAACLQGLAGRSGEQGPIGLVGRHRPLPLRASALHRGRGLQRLDRGPRGTAGRAARTPSGRDDGPACRNRPPPDRPSRRPPAGAARPRPDPDRARTLSSISRPGVAPKPQNPLSYK